MTFVFLFRLAYNSGFLCKFVGVNQTVHTYPLPRAQAARERGWMVLLPNTGLTPYAMSPFQSLRRHDMLCRPSLAPCGAKKEGGHCVRPP